MKESFSPARQEVSNQKEVLPVVSNFLSRFDKCKEYLKTVPENLKKAGLITVMFSMGVFNIAEAQDGDSNLNKIADDLVSKKINIENAADLIYQKIDKDSTYSYVEFNHSQNGQQSNIDVKVSGPEITSPVMGDTVSVGNYEAKEYFIMVTKDSKGTEFKQEGRFLSGIKPSLEKNEDTSSEKISYKSFGKTEQQAVITAIAGLAGLKNTKISEINQSIESQSDVNGITSNHSDFIGLSTSETKPTLLNNVKVVVLSTPLGFSAEAFCN